MLQEVSIRCTTRASTCHNASAQYILYAATIVGPAIWKCDKCMHRRAQVEPRCRCITACRPSNVEKVLQTLHRLPTAAWHALACLVLHMHVPALLIDVSVNRCCHHVLHWTDLPTCTNRLTLPSPLVPQYLLEAEELAEKMAQQWESISGNLAVGCISI